MTLADSDNTHLKAGSHSAGPRCDSISDSHSESRSESQPESQPTAGAAAWSIAKSDEHYRVGSWGTGYFAINEKGHLVVRPNPVRAENGNGQAHPESDLYDLVCALKQRGSELPILFRFDGIIQDRISLLERAFQDAIREVSYKGSYRWIYPVKVNQQRHIVEGIMNAGRGRNFGMLAGSKAELLAVMATLDEPGALLICSGFKDEQYIELALLARTIGRRTIILVEQLHEIEKILKVSAQLGIDPELGFRLKPSLKGIYGPSLMSDKSKFGLSASEIVLGVEELKRHDKLDALRLLQFHMGTQIPSIVSIKKVLKEASRVYVELAKLTPNLKFFDVGGGLAIDYDGSNTNFESSMNYSIDEYARDVVYAVEEACRETDIPHPDIISESGRALVAHHSVLVVEAIDVAPGMGVVPSLEGPPTLSEFLKRVFDLYSELTAENCIETLHDILGVKEEILERFVTSDIDLIERGYAEKVVRLSLAKIYALSRSLAYQPEELEKLEADLRDLYFCNFSVFQSIPDSWAVNQLFPIMPIHMLDREPDRKAMIADLTCDSDGKVCRFIDLKDVSQNVLFHSIEGGGPYYVGIFLVGAYQEILGDLHNLFGDTHAVHVNIHPDGEAELTHLVEGDRIREVLSYVQYPTADLLERLRISVEEALRKGMLRADESAKIQKRYKEVLDGYTYLVK